MVLFYPVTRHFYLRMSLGYVHTTYLLRYT
jgi:hypothetical protein